MTPEPAQSQVPPTCILTGAEGENPDDCTTHGHEGDDRRRVRVYHPFRSGPASWLVCADDGIMVGDKMAHERWHDATGVSDGT